MRVFDLEVLKKGEDGMYDLFQNTFDYTKENYFLSYTVTKEDEMRLDLISYKLYGTTDYMDIIWNVNNIDNPLNIKQGTVLIYPSTDLDSLRITPPEENESVRLEVTSRPIVDKTTRIDPNRQTYNQNNSSLPPTILDRKTNQIDISSNRIVFGSNLFKK
jgi:hypothetical protein